MMLNGGALRARRQELGITKRTLANLAGVTGTTITRLEECGDPDQLSVATLMKILRNLAVDLSEVIVPDLNTIPESTISIVEELGQLLHNHKKAMPRSHIAECMDLALSEVDSALLKLDELLRFAGLRIHHASTGVAIVASASSPRLSMAKEAAHRTRSFSVLNSGDLLLLYRIMHEGLDYNVIAVRNNGLVSLHKLENANLVQIEKGGRLRLSDRALAALGCDAASKM